MEIGSNVIDYINDPDFSRDPVGEMGSDVIDCPNDPDFLVTHLSQSGQMESRK